MKTLTDEYYKKAKGYLILRFGSEWYNKLPSSTKLSVTKKIAKKIKKDEDALSTM